MNSPRAGSLRGRAANFVDRAQLSVPRFLLGPETADAAGRICRRLDGIPMAIQLAAARAQGPFSGRNPRQAHDRFQLLTGGRDRAAAFATDVAGDDSAELRPPCA